MKPRSNPESCFESLVYSDSLVKRKLTKIDKSSNTCYCFTLNLHAFFVTLARPERVWNSHVLSATLAPVRFLRVAEPDQILLQSISAGVSSVAHVWTLKLWLSCALDNSRDTCVLKEFVLCLIKFSLQSIGEFQISPLFGLYLQHALIDSRALFLTLLLSFSWYSHSSNESLGPCMNIICIYRSKKRTPNIRAHLTIDIHRINNALKLIFCGVLAEWPHEVPQFFGCDEATVVLVKMLKSVEIFCVRISRIDSDYERFEI